VIFGNSTQTIPGPGRVGSFISQDKVADGSAMPTHGAQCPVGCARFLSLCSCSFSCVSPSLLSYPSFPFGHSRCCESSCYLKQLTSRRPTEGSGGLAVSVVTGDSGLVVPERRLESAPLGVQLSDAPGPRSDVVLVPGDQVISTAMGGSGSVAPGSPLVVPVATRGNLVVASADGARSVPDPVESVSCGSPSGTVFPGALCSASSMAGGGFRSRQRGLSSGTVFPGASVASVPVQPVPLRRIPRVAKRKRSVASLSPFDGTVKRRDVAVPGLARRRTAAHR